MFKKNKLSTERMIELEELLNKEILIFNTSFLDIIRELQIEEITYLKEAYTMPIQGITNVIAYYDTHKCNPVTYIETLCKTYNVSRETLIKRIQCVRRINFCKERMNILSK